MMTKNTGDHVFPALGPLTGVYMYAPNTSSEYLASLETLNRVLALLGTSLFCCGILMHNQAVSQSPPGDQLDQMAVEDDR